MKWFIKCLQNYVNFSGRARRAEYWYFVLFYVIFYIVAYMADIAINGVYGYPWISVVFGLALLLPSISVQIRRFHDIGKSGKNVLWYIIAEVVWVILLMVTGTAAMYILISGGNLADIPVSFLVTLFGGLLVFVVWTIIFIVWSCMPGDQGDNKYGPDPKALTE